MPAQSGPRYIEVTSENQQPHIHLKRSGLGEGFTAFSIDVDKASLEIPEDVRALLILRNEKGNLLSVSIKPTFLHQNVINFYSAIHLDLIKWAQVDIRDNMKVYSIKLAAFE